MPQKLDSLNALLGVKGWHFLGKNLSLIDGHCIDLP